MSVFDFLLISLYESILWVLIKPFLCVLIRTVPIEVTTHNIDFMKK